MNGAMPETPSFAAAPSQSGTAAVNDALAGLTVLGYSGAEIAPVLKKWKRRI